MGIDVNIFCSLQPLICFFLSLIRPMNTTVAVNRIAEEEQQDDNDTIVRPQSPPSPAYSAITSASEKLTTTTTTSLDVISNQFKFEKH